MEIYGVRGWARRVPQRSLRFGDLDANNHVNNAVFSTFFEAARVTLFRDPRRDARRALMPEGLIWTLAPERAREVAELPDDEFLHRLQEAFGFRLEVV
jgi:2-polyprenyl-6-methoxyphenol hydroxylase-like FAD-dependent oxidoreductase